MQTTAELCCLFRLQQRCQKLQRTAECTDCKIFLSAVVHIDLLTLFKRGQRILFYLATALLPYIQTPHSKCRYMLR